MLAYAARRAADVVHFQWLAMQWLDGYLLPRGRPLVLTAHDLLPREPRPGQASAQRRLYERVDAVVVHSQYGRRAAGRRSESTPARVHVIHHGAFDYLASAPHRRRCRRRWLPSSAPVVLFFGLIAAVQGPRHAARGVAGCDGRRAVDRRPAADAAAALRSRRPACASCSRFVSDAELPACFRRADIVVLPYTRTERLDFSGVLATALAFGRATVVSDVGGLGGGGDAGRGRLVPPDDPDVASRRAGDR